MNIKLGDVVKYKDKRDGYTIKNGDVQRIMAVSDSIYKRDKQGEEVFFVSYIDKDNSCKLEELKREDILGVYRRVE